MLHTPVSSRLTTIFAIATLFQLSSGNQGVEKVKSPIFAPNIQLSNGKLMPTLGLGTAGADVTGKKGEQLIKDAIDIGYRLIDTAWLYENEKEVGNAIRAKIAEGVIKREDVFVNAALWNTFHEPDQVKKAFEKSLENLNIDYIDLYVMQSPVSFQRVSKTPNASIDDIDNVDPYPLDANKERLNSDVDYVDTWKEMEKLLATGKVRSLGVSNFNSEQLDRLLSMATIRPVVNQVECHPNLNQLKLIAFWKARNITIEGYSPLGGPYSAGDRKLALKDPKVQQLATKYSKNSGQILLRYSYQNGVVTIPKSSNKERLRGNIDIFDFNLSEEEMTYLNSLNDNARAWPWEDGKDNKYYPFNIEF